MRFFVYCCILHIADIVSFNSGNEIAGDVVEVGKNVTSFSPGDIVVGLLDEGGFQQYNTVPEYALELVDISLT